MIKEPHLKVHYRMRIPMISGVNVNSVQDDEHDPNGIVEDDLLKKNTTLQSKTR